MRFHIYIDESGTHDADWFIIGMLFIPDHGALHSDLVKVKERRGYFNASPKKKARYKETHLAEFKSPRDVDVAKDWIDLFIKHSCYFRAVAVDWSLWNGKYFGDAFDPDALKRRRAYKKWAEMLLHPELKNPCLGKTIYHARLFLDNLRIMRGYDILGHLRERFMPANYKGESPYIEEFQLTDSWKDANQCLQLCDLLTGCIYQGMTPARSEHKLAARDYLLSKLGVFGVTDLSAKFWKQYAPHTLCKHFPKFSVWCWRPNESKDKNKKRRNGK